MQAFSQRAKPQWSNVSQLWIIHHYIPCKYNLHLWNIVGNNKCEFCNDVNILSQYFAECDSIVLFWKFLKRWFIRTFQFVISLTSPDIPLIIPNYDNNNEVMILNFVILFVKYYIYYCKTNGKPIDVFSFLAQLKSHLIIQEYRNVMYNRGLEIATKWSILSDSLWILVFIFPLPYSVICFTNSVLPKRLCVLCVSKKCVQEDKSNEPIKIFTVGDGNEGFANFKILEKWNMQYHARMPPISKQPPHKAIPVPNKC